MPSTHQAHPSQKFRLDKSTSGGITLLAMHGVIDEGFEGQKIAESVKTKKVIVSLRDVRRFASWGMTEWMNFLRGLAQHDLYLVECSTYAVNQMNLVTGLLGHGKLVSFYLPFRCGSCGEEFETLVLVPLDRGAIRDLGDSDRTCTTCGGSARVDKYPATMCAAIAERAVFDIDDEIVAFLRARLKYQLAPDVTRFRAFRRLHKGNVYLRLSGNLAMLPPEQLVRASEGTTVVDLANVMFEPDGLAPWRSYVHGALGTVGSLQLLDCPPGFLERGVRAEDLQSNLKVRTFALQYVCPNCSTSTTAVVDVALNLEQLTEGMVPTARCPSCQTMLVPPASDSILLLRRLPARERDAALDAFLARVRREPATRLEDCLVARPLKQARAPSGVARGVYVASALAALIVGGLAIGLVLWQRREDAQPAARAPQPAAAAPGQPAVVRPDWIVSDVPSSAFCHDMINRLVCVGVSSYRANRNDAVADATDAALEELVNSVGLKISEPVFRDGVLSGYSDARTKALSALQAVDADRSTPAYAAADERIRKARRRVVEVLQASGGPAVPAQRSDWYWEEYAVEKGSGTEFLVFVRHDVSIDAVKSLVEKYSTVTSIGAGGTAVMTAFPALAWQHDDFTGGVQLVKVGRPLAGAVEPQHLVMAIGDQRIADATSFARKLDEWTAATTGNLIMTVKAASGPARAITVRR